MNGTCLKTFKPKEQTQMMDLYIEPKTESLILAFKNKISFWKPEDEFDQILYWRSENWPTFHLNSNSDLFIYDDERKEMITYFNIIENQSLFMENRDIIKASSNKVNQDRVEYRNYKFLSFPFNYNIIQIYSYMKGRRDFFEEDYPPDLFFEKDIHSRNCFEIASMMRDGKLFTDCLDYILKNTTILQLAPMMSQQNQYFDSKFLYKFFRMFENDPKLLEAFLNYLFAQETKYEDSYPQISLKKPIVTTTDDTIITKETLMKFLEKHSNYIDEEAQMKELIKVKILYCDCILDKNDQGTIDVFKMISDFEPTNEIFSHRALIDLLEYKWETYARRIYFTEAFFFLILLMIYLLNSNYFLILRLEDEENEEESYNYIYSLVLDGIIVLFISYMIFTEGRQIISNKLKYFASIWNNIDLILISLMVVATICDILSCFQFWTYSDVLKVMHSFTIFFGYLRLFSYARGVEGTSFMIKLILQVLFDIRYFLLLMFIFIFALTSAGYFHIFLKLLNFFIKIHSLCNSIKFRLQRFGCISYYFQRNDWRFERIR